MGLFTSAGAFPPEACPTAVADPAGSSRNVALVLLFPVEDYARVFGPVPLRLVQRFQICLARVGLLELRFQPVEELDDFRRHLVLATVAEWDRQLEIVLLAVSRQFQSELRPAPG